jgi:hypothetical protein
MNLTLQWIIVWIIVGLAVAYLLHRFGVTSLIPGLRRRQRSECQQCPAVESMARRVADYNRSNNPQDGSN